MKKPIFWLIISILSISCTEEKLSYEKLPGQVRDMDNVIVHSLSKSLQNNIQLTKVQTYGDSEDLFFSRMGEFIVDDDGNVFIEESAVGRKSIQVFDTDGNHLGIIGREGKGPGEFEEICCMEITSDKLYVYDSVQGRMSLFSTEALDFLNTFYIDRVNLPDSDQKGQFNGNYSIMEKDKILMEFAPPVQFSENSVKIHSTYFYFDEEFQKISSKILRQEQVPHHWGYFEEHRIRETFPFFEKPLMAVSQSGRIFTAMSNHFFIKELDQEGNYLQSFYYNHKRMEVSREDAYKSSNDMSRNIAESIELPPYWPVLNSMQFDDEERLWISTFTEKEDQLKWWVLNTGGELLGTFHWQGDRYGWPLRNAYDMKVIRNGYFYAREHNGETGAHTVVKYRIEMAED